MLFKKNEKINIEELLNFHLLPRDVETFESIAIHNSLCYEFQPVLRCTWPTLCIQGYRYMQNTLNGPTLCHILHYTTPDINKFLTVNEILILNNYCIKKLELIEISWYIKYWVHKKYKYVGFSLGIDSSTSKKHKIKEFFQKLFHKIKKLL